MANFEENLKTTLARLAEGINQSVDIELIVDETLQELVPPVSLSSQYNNAKAG
jgi:hypothetical protein